ncbi:GNAT family N-acetyltransferase [Dyella subtropica]|uniref:GNAT family N-acetyltransferase n=1 Tax=Dyella subtropica TaxID=2992127 RepID=UPI0022578C4C|nr:GNAT family N-acetyltransferase [Dyella subtropica]
MSIDIHHESVAHRFEASVEGVLCVLDYTLLHGILTITHTIVPEVVGGRGIAANLVKFALDHARAEHWKVVPACSYAEAWMRRHPEYDDLRVG